MAINNSTRPQAQIVKFITWMRYQPFLVQVPNNVTNCWRWDILVMMVNMMTKTCMEWKFSVVVSNELICTLWTLTSVKLCIQSNGNSIRVSLTRKFVLCYRQLPKHCMIGLPLLLISYIVFHMSTLIHSHQLNFAFFDKVSLRQHDSTTENFLVRKLFYV